MKPQPFEQALERCLQEVARTGDAEAALAHYAQHADRLRPLLEVALATKRMYADVPAPPGGLAAGRRRLLAAAAQQRAQAPATRTLLQNTERKPKMQLVFATKIISAVMAVVFGLSAVGGGAALAAQASIPGDALYPVKLTSEDVALALASAPEGQVELALRFADQRVAEAQALVERGQQVPETVVARMEQHIWRAMNQAAWASDEEMPGLLEQIMQRTRAQAQALEPLQTRAHEQNRARLENAWRTCQQAHEEAMAGLQDPQAFRSRYQQRTGMPEDITPPEPPTRGPQEGEAGPHGPAEPGQNRAGSPQGEQQGDLDRERDREQDQDRDPQQDRNCSQQQDQDCDPEQDRDRDRQQDQDGDQQQDQDRDRQQDQDGDQQQDQDQEQQQDPQQGEPQQGAQQDQGQQGPQQGQQQDQGGDQQQDQQQDHQQDGQQDQQQDQQPDQQPGPRHGP